MNDDRFQEIAANADGQALNGIWDQLIYDTLKFERKRALFLFILERLLRRGNIKLHKNGVLLAEPVNEQVDAFRQLFPKSEDDADRICTKPGNEAPYTGFGMNVWWFLDVCPAGVAWRQPDGACQEFCV